MFLSKPSELNGQFCFSVCRGTDASKFIDEGL